MLDRRSARLSLGFRAAVLALAMASAQCGRDDSSSSGGGPANPPGSPIALDALGDEFERLLCRYLIECTHAPYRDVEQCVRDRHAEGLSDVLSGVEEGRITYNPARVGQCRDLFLKNLCDPFFLLVPSVPDVLQLCLNDVGNQPSGAACRHDLECAKGLFCSSVNYACPGTCKPFQKEGEYCAVGSEYDCQPSIEVGLVDLLSDPRYTEQRLQELRDQQLSCENNLCQRARPIGQSCGPTERCAGGGYCDPGSGVCLPPIQEGGNCSTESQCVEGLWCDQPTATNGVCRALGGAGMVCDSERDCVEGLRCVPSTVRGACALQGGQGQPCSEIDDCRAGLACSGSVCAELPTKGGLCANGEICAPGFICTPNNICETARAPGESCNATDLLCIGVCTNGICEARREVGQSCTNGVVCTTRSCQGGICIDSELCEFNPGI